MRTSRAPLLATLLLCVFLAPVFAEVPLRLRSGSVRGASDAAGLPPRLRLAAEALDDGGPALLAFEGAVPAAALERARQLGVRLAAPLGRGGYIAWLPPGGLAAARELPGLAFAAPFHPGLRLAPEVATLRADDPRPRVQLSLTLFAHADVESVRRRLEGLGLTVNGSREGSLESASGPGSAAGGAPAPSGGGTAERPARIAFSATPAQLVAARETIAGWPETIWLATRPAFGLLNNDSAWVGQSGLSAGQTTPVHDRGLLGEGQVVGVLDTGIDADMCYFRDGVLGLPPTQVGLGTGAPDPNQRKLLIVDFLWDQDDPANDGDWDSQDHGTHVAGSVAGDDLQTVGERDHGDGMAPRAKLVIQDGGYQVDDCADLPALGCPVVDLVPIFQQAYDQGARLHTNSWGDRENFSPQNIYSDGSQDADEFMWTHPDFLLLFAAGNSGPSKNTVGSPATAKNVVAVGATAHGASAGSLASFSSRGKTEDGRIKPDVTIPGSSVVSANNDGSVSTDNCSTQSMSGTSMASPTAAGLAALVREYFDKGFYPDGAASPPDAFTPSAALVKATLIASATAMENLSEPPPSDDQGWGRILLDDALYFPGDTSRLQVIDEAAGFDASGQQSEEQWIDVAGSGAPLKLVLAWTDYPSTPAAATNLVNDLDLVLRDPAGTVYRGNNFSSGASVSGGSADRLNNVEVIRIPAPATGLWSVTVEAHEIQQPAQPWALAITGELGDPSPPAAGRASFEENVTGCSQQIGLRVVDGNAGATAVDVVVWSESEVAGEPVTLSESQPGSGRYTGSILSTAQPAAPGDGLLSLADGDTLTIEYRDGDDGQGAPRLAWGTATADCRGPAIRNVHVTGLTDQRLTVAFDTDEPGTTVVDWGPTPALGHTAASSDSVSSHALVINQLSACGELHFAVRSADRFGNESSAGAGAPFAAQSALIPGLYWQETFEGDVSGWTLDGEWEVGTPAGLGSSTGGFHPDPVGAYDNLRALGNDLGGSGAWPGDYEPGAGETARSPQLDARSFARTELLVTRSLNVDAADTASISIFAGGTIPVWNNSGAAIKDAGYRTERYDVSSDVDGRPAISLIFGLGADADGQAAGWTIDNLVLKDAAEPDYAACGGCAAAPSFAGASRAVDIDPCGGGGVRVEWEPAASWGSGAGGSYAVYRGASADFVPDAQSLVASGLTGSSWDDAAAPQDQRSWYIVRAENDETCGGGPDHGGLTDDNLARAAVDERTATPAPPEITALEVTRAGAAHLRLDWQETAQASEYQLYRSPSPAPADLTPATRAPASGWLDLGAAADGASWFYLVRGVNACDAEGP